eukprot:TRINITY_DN15656_c0_g1_i1.p3 TRINITY_DN15656_c0_g1~~TRINITY_DN15656_c0_g1_i1.p3  ORF type:complete len:114 (+),score=10.82 TRINITY_DN15656_c0_g1_i1:79-420(+)
MSSADDSFQRSLQRGRLVLEAQGYPFRRLAAKSDDPTSKLIRSGFYRNFLGHHKLAQVPNSVIASRPWHTREVAVRNKFAFIPMLGALYALHWIGSRNIWGHRMYSWDGPGLV